MSTSSASSSPRRGRPRSTAVREAILDAVGALLVESDTPSRVTMDAIVRRARTSKATVYRWWGSRGALLLEAFTRVTSDTLEVPDSASTEEALTAQLEALARLFSDARSRGLIIALTVEAQHDAATATALRDSWLGVRRASANSILRRGIERGELRADLDREAAIDQLFAPLYHRAIYGHQPIHADRMRANVRLFLEGAHA